MNKENLLRLAEYLEGPELKAAFDISRFSEITVDTEADDFSETECGSVGCAVGHGPYAGIKKLNSESWLLYAYRAFKIGSLEFRFLFNAGWYTFHNSPTETAQRIRYFINQGVPRDWDGNYDWTPPVEQPLPQQAEKVIYKFVERDEAVKELTEAELSQQ